jgi:hypothetical protein
MFDVCCVRYSVCNVEFVFSLRCVVKLFVVEGTVITVDVGNVLFNILVGYAVVCCSTSCGLFLNLNFINMVIIVNVYILDFVYN